MIAPISLSRSPRRDLSLIFADPKFIKEGSWDLNCTNYSESIINNHQFWVRIDHSLMDAAVELFVSPVARKVDVIFNPEIQATVCILQNDLLNTRFTSSQILINRVFMSANTFISDMQQNLLSSRCVFLQASSWSRNARDHNINPELLPVSICFDYSIAKKKRNLILRQTVVLLVIASSCDEELILDKDEAFRRFYERLVVIIDRPFCGF